jgi:hypothetical protein
MKRYQDLTSDELCALTTDEIDRYCDIEMMLESNPVVDCPHKPTLEDHGIKQEDQYFECKNILFKSREDAETFQSMTIYADSYNYTTGYDFRFAQEQKSSGIIDKVFYTEHDLLRAADVLSKNKKASDTYDSAMSDYTKYKDKSSGVVNNIYDAIRLAKEKVRKVELAQATWEKYLNLSDGDIETAEKFFRDSYSDEELIDKILGTKGGDAELKQDDKES